MKLGLLFLSTVAATAIGANAFSTVSSVPQERVALLGKLPESGFICNGPDEVSRVCEACADLEKAATPRAASGRRAAAGDGTTMELNGKWKLRFTSASPYGLLRSLPGGGVTLPDPLRSILIDDSLLLATRVEQKIDSTSKRIVNIVDLSPWPTTAAAGGGSSEETTSTSNDNPFSGLLSSLPGPIGQTLDALRGATVRLQFDHSFEHSGGKSDLKLETISRSLEGASDSLPDFVPRETSYNLPIALTGSFETTYIDSTLRIARGTSFPFQDEILVFERDAPLGMTEEMPEECELEFEEDGTMVMMCEGEDEGATVSD